MAVKKKDFNVDKALESIIAPKDVSGSIEPNKKLEENEQNRELPQLEETSNRKERKAKPSYRGHEQKSYYLSKRLIKGISYRSFKTNTDKSEIVRAALEQYLKRDLLELEEQGIIEKE